MDEPASHCTFSQIVELRSFYNILRRPCEEVTAPQGAAAHSLGTTGLHHSKLFLDEVFVEDA
jgi:hypothetical protein